MATIAFDDAVATLKAMFTDVDREVIESVLDMNRTPAARQRCGRCKPLTAAARRTFQDTIWT